MKKLLILLLGSFLFISCSSDDNDLSLKNDYSEKEMYIHSVIPNILNLEKTEIEDFKRSMVLENGELVSWNSNLLKKAYIKNYTEISNIIATRANPLQTDDQDTSELDSGGGAGGRKYIVYHDFKKKGERCYYEKGYTCYEYID